MISVTHQHPRNPKQVSALQPRALVLLLLLSVAWPQALAAFDWVPTDEEIQKYRKSWNPFSHGPILLQAVDIQPKAQASVRYFVFSQIGEHSYGNRFTLVTERKDGPVHLYAVSPSVNLAYGLTNHIELGASFSVNAFWAKDSEAYNQGKGGPWTTNTGLGDASLIVKYRPIIQDPDSWRPSFTTYTQLVLPSSRWASTERPPGGFAPFGRLPNTRFGELGLTEGLMIRKNLEPFRISSAVFYTYSLPGSDAGMTTYNSDVINTRLIIEHILDDKRGFGYNIEFSTLHGVPWRLDGHALNSGQRHGFSVIGIEPGIQWRFLDNWVAAAGVLVTVAGQNAIEAVHPNFSIFWYWNKSGKAIMR